MSSKIIKNFLSPHEIEFIKSFYQNKEFENRGFHPDTEDLQWANSSLKKEIRDLLHDRLLHLLGDYKISPGCGKFQRCYVPFGIHTDSKVRIDNSRNHQDIQQDGTALLIPMQEGPKLTTIIWQEKCFDDTEKIKLFESFGALPTDRVRDSGIGKKYDLDFCWGDPNPQRKLYNHLELDNVFEWKIGDAVTWNRNQLHASEDFRSQHPYKDAVTIFFE